MKTYKVTHPKAFAEGKEIPVGTTFELEDDAPVPGLLVGKVELVTEVAEEVEVKVADDKKKAADGGTGDKK